MAEAYVSRLGFAVSCVDPDGWCLVASPRLGDCETVLQLALACVRDDMLLAELDEASRTTIK